MFDEQRRLFCHSVESREKAIVRKGVSRRYTTIALLGLRELELAGFPLPFDLRGVYSLLVQDLSWIAGVGDLGLLIWLGAHLSPNDVDGLIRRLDCETALERYPDAQESRTTELAWFLAGLAHVAGLSTRLSIWLTDIAVDTYHRIEGNQGEYGMFGHMNPHKSLAGRLRGRIGNFADQAYSIYAISRFAKSFHVEDPLGPALDCANAICNAQGERGQWWWLYDSCGGRVSGRYPVYSVHQYGLGPMALFAIEEATGQDFWGSIYKGLRWVQGDNEIGTNLRDDSNKLIWRCVLPKYRRNQFWGKAVGVLWPGGSDLPVGQLEISLEQRPYEFGWLLFAFANRVPSPPLATV